MNTSGFADREGSKFRMKDKCEEGGGSGRRRSEKTRQVVGSSRSGGDDYDRGTWEEV